MSKRLFIALLSCMIPFSIWSQLQYVAVPRSGEARFERSEKSEFWANPIFFKPSVFFSSDYATPRTNRKWWRQHEVFIPVPDTPWVHRVLLEETRRAEERPLLLLPDFQYRKSPDLYPATNRISPVRRVNQSLLPN